MGDGETHVVDTHANFFPVTQPIAKEWASECLGQISFADEEVIGLLIPIVENDDKVIISLVSTFLGRKCRGMTLTEMRELILRQSNSLRNAVIDPEHRSMEIKNIDDQVSHLKVKKLNVDGDERYNHVTGSYDRKENSNDYNFVRSHHGGAACAFWEKSRRHMEEEPNTITRIESKDVYGSTWEIYTLPIENSEGDEEGKQVLFRWDNGFCSLVPPKRGWEEIDENTGGINVDSGLLYLRFIIESQKFY